MNKIKRIYMLQNLNIEELLIMGALAYAAYRAYVIKDNVAAIILAIAAVFLMNLAGGSTDTFEGPDSTGFAISELSGLEMILVAAVLYAAYRLFKAGETTAAIVAGAAGVYTGFLGGTGSGTTF